MSQKRHFLNDSVKSELTRLFLIGVGVFLFILFFQPFPLDTLDYNNRLLYVTGFGVITFLLCFIVLVVLQFIFPKWIGVSEWDYSPPFILNIILLILTSVAYSFYIRYVGKTYLTLYVLFKIFLVCLLPVIILGILYRNKSLEIIIKNLQKQNTTFLSRIKTLEDESDEQLIHIYSDNKADKLSVQYRDLILVKSADNYIEIYFQKKEKTEKKLLRNTLKNIQTLLIHKPNIMRCHRTSIVNIKYVQKLKKTYNGYSLKMAGLDIEIPVSRQYLIMIREAINDI